MGAGRRKSIFGGKTVDSHGVRDRQLQENLGLLKALRCVCVRMRMSVCVYDWQTNTLSLTRDLSRSQLDLILISCFTLLLFFGKTFTQQARQISIHKYVIENSQRERDAVQINISANVEHQRSPETRRDDALCPIQPTDTKSGCFPKQAELFLNHLIHRLSFSFWSSSILHPPPRIFCL